MPTLTTVINCIRPNSPASYLFALGCVVVAAAIRLVVDFYHSEALPFLPFFPAIVIVGLFAGTWSALFALALSAGITAYLFVRESPPTYLTIGEAISLALFLGAGLSIILLTALFRSLLTKLQFEEQQRELLVKELEHRSKNKLAVIESILRFTMADKAASDNAIDRIRSAVSTVELLGLHSEASLKTILTRPFVPYGDNRVYFSGHDITIPAHVARALAMVFHEMTTNSAKYGALKHNSGRIYISWLRKEEDVILTWKEKDGPPVIAPQAHSFGTRLIKQTLKHLGGTIRTEFPPDGLQAIISFRVSSV